MIQSPNHNPSRGVSGSKSLLLIAVVFLLPALARTWAAEAPSTNAPPASAETPQAPTQLPTVIVVAQKEPAEVESLPVSVSPVTREILQDVAIYDVKDAEIYAPNVFVNEFSARKLSNPYFRGVGASPNNPGVTTYIDGVPQLNGNSSSIELIDVDQVEFVRGPQGALFGRNTVGGLINITSRRPPLTGARSSRANTGITITGAFSCRSPFPSRVNTIDVKVCTPVTQYNIGDVPAIAHLVEGYSQTTQARVFYNVFQAFPRAMFSVNWARLVVTDEQFAALKREIGGNGNIRINFLDHQTLDRLYVMVFPDGSMTIPKRPEYLRFGPFWEIVDYDQALYASQFDSARHIHHSRGWGKDPTARGQVRVASQPAPVNSLASANP